MTKADVNKIAEALRFYYPKSATATEWNNAKINGWQLAFAEDNYDDVFRALVDYMHSAEGRYAPTATDLARFVPKKETPKAHRFTWGPLEAAAAEELRQWSIKNGYEPAEDRAG